MSSPARLQDNSRLLALLFTASLVVLLACIAGVFWARGSDVESRFLTHDGTAAAYGHVVPGHTLQPELVKLGFDAMRPGARRLDGAGVQEYFLTGSSRDFDRLAPAIRDCFAGEDRCSVLVFPVEQTVAQDGFFAAHAATRGRILFVLRSGLVTYKVIST